MAGHHQGSGRRHVFPDGWQEHHAVVVDDTHDSWVEIRPPHMSQEWDDDLGQTVTVKAPAVWTGWATVEPKETADGRLVVVAGDLVPVRVYEVVIERIAVEVAADEHVVDVVSSPDPLLEGARLFVRDVEVGSRRFSRALTSTLNR